MCFTIKFENMKRILPEFEFSDEQFNIVRGLARECNLCEETVRILYGRGIRDRESILNFMHPSKQHFISPFKMSGMREAVELITLARDEGWVVVVYGDYDADGICASTIMGNALKDFGIEPVLCVPERRNGYGLSQGLIDEIFEEYFPQLIITVDCGISCADEIEYIKEQGAEVIVTDHHELPDRIPNCICINPKFNDGYIYDNLCGAGVAFKVGCALNGEAGYKYLDYVAIATVADSVPLTGENRDIVFEGLKIINAKPAETYAQFINKQDVVTSQTLAFSIAPKINAAGRMGDAKAALELFNESDATKIYELCAKLTAYNLERQQRCDELYNSAKEMIKENGYRNIILLWNENWNSGFVGIVAARLADEYSCPAILFVKNNGMLKGSARSVENVNIFEALKSCSQYIQEFGGHSQAAGVNVSEDNFENLKAALEDFISANYKRDDFIPTIYVNGELNGQYSLKLVKELEMLEPYGVGNRRPLFALETGAVHAKAVKTHLSLKSENLDLMFFSGLKYKKLIESSVPKKLIFEYNVSSFRGKEYVKGFVRDIVYDSSVRNFANENIALSAIEMLAMPKVSAKESYLSKQAILDMMSAGSDSTIYIAWDNETVEAFENPNGINCELFTPSVRNFSEVILIAPSADCDLSGYKRVVFLNGDIFNVRLPSLKNKIVEYCDTVSVPEFINNLSCDREALLAQFAEISAKSGTVSGENLYDVALSLNAESKQTMFALEVFKQLGLIIYEGGYIQINRGVKTKLENSELYNIVKEVQTK